MADFRIVVVKAGRSVSVAIRTLGHTVPHLLMPFDATKHREGSVVVAHATPSDPTGTADPFSHTSLLSLSIWTTEPVER